MMKKLFATAMLVAGVGSVNAAVNMPAGRVAQGETASAVCAACHGVDGNSASAEFPRLAGQNARYIFKQLMDYQTGRRQNAIMQDQVKSLTPQQMADLAAYFA